MSPTARTLAWLRRHGYQAAVVERWNPHARRRVDLFGWIDVVACKPGECIMGVQATTAPNLSARVAKARGLPQFAGWLDAGGAAWFVGWSLRGPRGGRKLWTPRIVTIHRGGEIRTLDEAEHVGDEP